MIIVCHRINTIKQLKKIPYNYGVEVDVRDYNNNLILNHDPFKNGENFLSYLKHFKHKFIIINIKSEGIEKRVYKILKQNKIYNFFLLDVSIPFIVKLHKKLNKKIAIRVSDVEDIKTAKNFKNMLDWAWLDFFKIKKIRLNYLKNLKKLNYKTCYVSHELQERKANSKEINYLKTINSKNFNLDMIIVKKKNLNKWEKFFYNV